ncbi:site-specific DNA recombinase [Caminicella sporogenes DSM 14501]|uniref:Site-specific DNA recombinase n=1 Tax=Caminicella sporogenes DSM 14501 TaxID=1121266 RepID=A0A1M6LPF9_9FIRM|nr:recombinase family protein [Caminicella sporogenes]RKD27904.1 hypothetical protein BET04_02255 [Caminicella sporogenes]SHJ73077.1 site-specific DNA recombinase [Caminicella sporogenes DSM 14501]
MKGAIYSRKSKFTSKGESTKNQIEMCKEYAKNHFNINEFIIYEDEGFSGGDAKRPEFIKMLEDAKKNKFKILICYRLDRISRNISDFSNLIELLQNNGISFVSIREQFDTSTPMGRAMMYIASVFAQLERETIAERIRDNMLQLAKTGRWLGGKTPTGYESKPITYIDSNMKQKKMFKLSPIEEELKIVEKIYSKYIEFQSLSKLETYCIQKGIKSKNDKYFTKYTLKTILTNPVYAKADTDIYNYFLEKGAQIASSKSEFNGNYGIMAYNKKNVKKGKSVKDKDISEWIIAVGKHKGIISGKDWILVQNNLIKNKSKAPRQGTSNTALLSGLIKCKKCGSFLRVKYGSRIKGCNERYHYYVCNNKEISRGKLCNINNLVGRHADEKVADMLKEMIKNGIIDDIDKIKKDLKNEEFQNKKILKKINENKLTIQNLLEQLKQNKSEIVAKYIFSEIEKIDRENENLKSKLNNKTTEDEIFNIEILKNTMIKFLNTYDKSSFNQKRNMLKSIIEKIEWDGENLYIHIL